MIIDLHYEDRNKAPKLEWLVILPICFSLIPTGSTGKSKRIPEEDREVIRESLKNYRSLLGQQGLTHKCKKSHSTADPWHENYCLWERKPSSTR